MEDKEKFVGATSDERVVNNVMRHEYRVLTDAEKAAMKAIKDKGLEFINLLYSIAYPSAGGTIAPGTPYNSRELSLCATKVEEAVMWGVKHITK